VIKDLPRIVHESKHGKERCRFLSNKGLVLSTTEVLNRLMKANHVVILRYWYLHPVFTGLPAGARGPVGNRATQSGAIAGNDAIRHMARRSARARQASGKAAGKRSFSDGDGTRTSVQPEACGWRKPGTGG
jgi:hypothetical protein